MSVIEVSQIAKRAMKYSIDTLFSSMPMPQSQKSPEDIIDLSPGDPSVRPYDFNNVASEEVKMLLRKPETYYCLPETITAAHEYVADLHSASAFQFKSEDIFFTQGGEFALTYAMRMVCLEGDNFIVPNPGYWHLELAGLLYKREKRSYGFDDQWNIKFEELESQIDSRTKFILIVSPGNPNCVTYTLKDFQKFTEIAKKHNLVLISDEIYYGMTFDTKQLHLSPAHVDSDVPVIIMSGLAKTCSVPGFALEWLAIKDPADKIERIRGALQGLISSFGTGSVFIQNILPAIFNAQKPLAGDKMTHISNNFEIIKQHMKDVPQIKIMPSTASMFASLIIQPEFFNENLKDDHNFCSLLFKEEGLKFGRGTFNGQNNLIRVSLILNEAEYRDGLPRLIRFIQRHRKFSNH